MQGLVTYPETPTGTSAVTVTHQCAANAEVSGGGLVCNTIAFGVVHHH